MGTNYLVGSDVLNFQANAQGGKTVPKPYGIKEFHGLYTHGRPAVEDRDHFAVAAVVGEGFFVLVDSGHTRGDEGNINQRSAVKKNGRRNVKVKTPGILCPGRGGHEQYQHYREEISHV